MTRQDPTIRLARPEELATLVAIDDAAGALFAEAGLVLDLGMDHPFVRDERARWARAIARGLALVAVDARDEALGFAVLGALDEAPYLEQLAVHPRAMRRGIGGALLRRALELCEPLGEIWLTTYAHLAWNRPYYERHGFEVVAGDALRPEIASTLAAQKGVLPEPDRRIAMVRRWVTH